MALPSDFLSVSARPPTYLKLLPTTEPKPGSRSACSAIVHAFSLESCVFLPEYLFPSPSPPAIQFCVDLGGKSGEATCNSPCVCYLQIYPVMEKEGRTRLALIICNKKFDYLSEREGSENDISGMQGLLENLGYSVVIKENLTALVMAQESGISFLPPLSFLDFFLCSWKNTVHVTGILFLQNRHPWVSASSNAHFYSKDL